MMCKSKMAKSYEDRFNMIPVRDLLMALELEIKISENTIAGGEVPYKGWTSSIFSINIYNFKSIIVKIIGPKKNP